MQFFLTDLALGAGAILAYLTYELLMARRAHAVSMASGGPGSRDVAPQRPPAKTPRAALRPPGKRTPPAEFMILDPKRLARLW